MDMHGSLPFSKAFDFASGAIGERFQNPFWKLKELLLGTRLRKAVFKVRSFGNAIVSAAVQKRKDEGANGEKLSITGVDPLRSNLIDSLLDNIKDHQVVADAAMNYLSAGERLPPATRWQRLLTFHRSRHHRTVSDLDFIPPNAAPSSRHKN